MDLVLRSEETQKTAPCRLEVLVDRIINLQIDAAVLIVSLTPLNGNSVDVFNKQFCGMLEARSVKGKKVAFVDASTVTKSDLADKVHWNDKRYMKIADARIENDSTKYWITDPVNWISSFHLSDDEIFTCLPS
jgi:hypothetical protein